MANTSYLKEKKFVPLDCKTLTFEEFPLQAAMEGIKEIDVNEFKENIEINEIETLDVLENLLDDFSCVDLKKEVILGLRQLEYKIQTAEMANHKY